MNLHKEATLAISSMSDRYDLVVHTYAAKHPKSFIDSAAKFLRVKDAEKTDHRVNFGKVALETLSEICNGAPYWMRDLCYRYAAKHPKSFLMVVKPELFQPQIMKITLKDDGAYHFCVTIEMRRDIFDKCKAACMEEAHAGRKISGIVKARAIANLGLREAKTFYEMVERGLL